MNDNKGLALVPPDHEMMVYNTMAKQAVESKFYRNVGDSSAVMTIMLSARELGISPMAALNGGLNIINGKVEISARMMNALIRRAGHSLNTIKSTDTECEITGKRSDNGDSESASFSLEDAKQAGLVKPGGGWSKYPSDMLYARTLSRLARRLFPDVIGCAYVEGEISGEKASMGVRAKEETEILTDAETIEVKVNETELVKTFVSTFDKEDQMFMQEYIKQVHGKFGIGYQEIIDKHTSKPDDFMEKFEKWKEQQSKA